MADRPEGGLAQGTYAAPGWAVWAIGTAIVIVALVSLWWRSRGGRRT